MTNKPYDVYKELADTKLALLQAERRADNAVKMSNLTMQQLALANEQMIKQYDQNKLYEQLLCTRCKQLKD